MYEGSGISTRQFGYLGDLIWIFLCSPALATSIKGTLYLAFQHRSLISDFKPACCDLLSLLTLFKDQS